MNSQSNIGIVYICTGKYNLCYESFINSAIKYFYPNNKKHFIILTDQVNNNIYNDNYIIEYHYLRHYPWPINTLFKMHYIYEYLDELSNCDLICYFNANIEFYRYITDYNIFLDNKLYVTTPYNTTNPVEAMEKNFVNPKSTAYIDNYDYKYIRGWMFIGNYEQIKTLCEFVIDKCNIDLHNCIIPSWHDESYLNKYAYIYNDNINIIYHGIGDYWNNDNNTIALIIDKKEKYNFNKYSI